MLSENETALRLFLERHNYPLPDTSVPVQFNPDLPIEIFWTVSPFPSQAGELTALATAVFRQVCQLVDECLKRPVAISRLEIVVIELAKRGRRGDGG